MACENCGSDQHLACHVLEPEYQVFGKRDFCTRCGRFNDFKANRICNSCDKIIKNECNCCGQTLPKTFGCNNHKMEKISDIRNGNGLGRKVSWYCKSCKSSIRTLDGSEYR